MDGIMDAPMWVDAMDAIDAMAWHGMDGWMDAMDSAGGSSMSAAAVEDAGGA
jgi:hypothetical protein